MRYIALLSVICIALVSIGWVSDGGWDQGLINNRQYGSIVPGADNTYDIGSTSKAWRNVYVDGSIYIPSNLKFVGGAGVGIGTTSPRTALEVSGTIYTTNMGINVISPLAKIDVINSGSESLLKLGNISSGDVFSVVSTGSIGVNVVSPSSSLDIGGFTKSNVLAANSLGVKGDVEVDGKIYADQSIYFGSAVSGTGGMAACLGVNASGKYLYFKATCP